MATIVDKHHNPDSSDSEAGLDDAEYESESEGTSALALRRREASDDDDQDERLQRRSFLGHDAESRRSFSDADTEAEGAPPMDDEEEDDEGIDSRGLLGRRQKASGVEDEEGDEFDDEDLEGDEGEEDIVENSLEDNGDPTGSKPKGVGAEDGGEKKEVEPFVVPTAGAFYMHDDRFRESGSARPRRSPGGRKLWEAKDDKRWVHDMFEEFHIHNEGRGLRRGRGRSRGRGRGMGRGRGQGIGRERVVKMNAFDDQGSIRSRLVSGRGGGFNRAVVKGQKQEDTANISTSGVQGSVASEVIEKDSSSSTNQTETAVPKRLVSVSILNSSSPPFYPSGASQPLVGKAPVSEVSGLKNVNMDVVKVTEGASVKKVAASGLVFVPKPSHQTDSVSSDIIPVSSQKSPGGSSYQLTEVRMHSDAQQTPFKPAGGSNNQAKVGKFQGSAQVVNLPSASQPLTSVVAPPLGRGQSPIQLSFTGRPQEQISPQLPSQHQGQASGGMLHGSTVSTLGSGAPQLSVSGRLKSAGAGGGGSGVLTSRVAYNGAGPGGISSGVVIGEQAYAPSQPIAPVAVQYAGQSQGGLGVPAVGVALPSFGGQHQYGFGNSEITWVPVLAGGGALGVGFGSPYVAMEGTPPTIFYAQPPVQSSTFKNPGGDHNASKTTLAPWKPPQASGSEEFEHRQNKPRRYSEMNFGH
ncbi:hypothetical protein O6H91_05G110900 [Diphasiastrum complanatum]|uniref:Uncharacterized protein n=1 Tax=Diphasiastrum complanatum TaxID=34168 RepID=A0ACC2DS85_DIPCM|nr:hypothetical protein O6H91_05G110900 [Diphasiastrum complanatum]